MAVKQTIISWVRTVFTKFETSLLHELWILSHSIEIYRSSFINVDYDSLVEILSH